VTGKQKHPNNYFFYNEYIKLPPQLRTIPNLFTVLKQKETEIPYKLVSENSLYRYKKEMEWDKRIYKSLGTITRKKHMENTDYFIQELWKDTLDYHNRIRKQKKKIDWNEIEDLTDTEKIQNLNNIQKIYDTSFKTLTGTPISISEMYFMLDLLKNEDNNENIDTKQITNQILNDENMSHRLTFLQKILGEKE